jgi:hypothetical protein
MQKITVVLPVHNGANYLESAIASVLAQDCEFMLHVLDDGSTDATPEIAQSTSDSRVRYSRNPGRFGLFKTLNRGFSEAKTPLVRIWAHDDLMVPGSLKRFVDFAETHPSAGMVYCDFWAIDTQGNRTGKERQFERQRIRTPELSDPGTSALLFYCFGCLPGNISTVMLRRQTWQGAGGFVEGIQQGPEYDMWVRISASSQIGFVRDKLIKLRDHPLQLGRVGQKQTTTVDEELVIYRKLQEALEPAVPRSRLVSFWMCNRGRQHAHWIMRALLSGNFAAARHGWQALARYGRPWQQLLVWLATANGRAFTQRGDVFFDEFLPRVASAREQNIS